MRTKSLVALVLLVSVKTADCHLNLYPVAVMPRWDKGVLPCCDADGDGLFECYLSPVLSDTCIAYEFVGNAWTEHLISDRAGLPLAVGDGDRDGKSDLISGQTVFEALRPDTFPTESVWSANLVVGVDQVEFTDLDKDSLIELTFESGGVNGNGIFVFENRGDNRYERVPFPGTNDHPRFCTGDFDLDGRMELASARNVSNTSCSLFVYECTGPDQYCTVCSTDLSPEYMAYHFGSANDMDGDGWPKLIYESRGPFGYLNLHVLEEPMHGQFTSVWQAQYPYANYPGLATGDLTGDGRDELVLNTGLEVRVFKAVGIHQYEEQWQWPKANVFRMRVFDINGDGRDELIMSVFQDSTYVFEDTSGLTALQFERLPKPQVMNLTASIVRAGSSVSFPNLNRNTEVVVYDVRGRVITKHTATGAEVWRWNLTDQHGRHVPAGTYFVLIRCQGQTASTKLCVVN